MQRLCPVEGHLGVAVRQPDAQLGEERVAGEGGASPASASAGLPPCVGILHIPDVIPQSEGEGARLAIPRCAVLLLGNAMRPESLLLCHRARSAIRTECDEVGCDLIERILDHGRGSGFVSLDGADAALADEEACGGGVCAEFVEELQSLRNPCGDPPAIACVEEPQHAPHEARVPPDLLESDEVQPYLRADVLHRSGAPLRRLVRQPLDEVAEAEGLEAVAAFPVPHPRRGGCCHPARCRPQDLFVAALCRGDGGRGRGAACGG